MRHSLTASRVGKKSRVENPRRLPPQFFPDQRGLQRRFFPRLRDFLTPSKYAFAPQRENPLRGAIPQAVLGTLGDVIQLPAQGFISTYTPLARAVNTKQS